jgi:hypothetical protein
MGLNHFLRHFQWLVASGDSQLSPGRRRSARPPPRAGLLVARTGPRVVAGAMGEEVPVHAPGGGLWRARERWRGWAVARAREMAQMAAAGGVDAPFGVSCTPATRPRRATQKNVGDLFVIYQIMFLESVSDRGKRRQRPQQIATPRERWGVYPLGLIPLGGCARAKTLG